MTLFLSNENLNYNKDVNILVFVSLLWKSKRIMLLRTEWMNTFYNNEHVSHFQMYCNVSMQFQLTTQPTKFCNELYLALAVNQSCAPCNEM
jgi:hypothetical protein